MVAFNEPMKIIILIVRHKNNNTKIFMNNL